MLTESGQLFDTPIDCHVTIRIIRVAYAEVTRVRRVTGSAGREDECVLGNQLIEERVFAIPGQVDQEGREVREKKDTSYVRDTR